MTPDHLWEQGSEFHAHSYLRGERALDPWSERGIYFGSARHALRALIKDAASDRGWRRIWLPSYFCSEVFEAIGLSGLELRVYSAAPGGVEWPLSLVAGDVLLVVNLFGMRGRAPAQELADGVEVIEDHTHDPWSDWAAESRADWCIASLRKTLPIPDGSVLWSPVGRELPPVPSLSTEHALASLDKWAGMSLKALYLAGAPVEKRTFREMMVSAETRLGVGEPSAISPLSAALLPTLPTRSLREQRAANFARFSTRMLGSPGVEVLRPDGPGACAFSAVLLFETAERREQVRQALIGARIYPAVLWPLEGPTVRCVPEGHLDLSRRTLSIHCDARYSGDDIERVARLVRELNDAFTGSRGGSV